LRLIKGYIAIKQNSKKVIINLDVKVWARVKEFCHLYMFHRKDAEGAERKFLYKKPLQALRLCGEL
jgi:hypothetical protein